MDTSVVLAIIRAEPEADLLGTWLARADVRRMSVCFAYALARDAGEPLLYQGRDFALTDIEQLTEPVKGNRLSEAVAAYLAG